MTAPIALITGASGGLGRAIALAYAKAHYTVALHYHQSKDKALKLEQEIRALGGDVLLVQGDVRVSSDVNAFVKAVHDKYGRIDVLVNNAGSSQDQLLARMSDDEWNNIIQLNLNGPFFVTRAVWPIMQEQKEGSIINIGSYVSNRVVRGGANYSASKAGLIALTKSTALEGGVYNIRANVVLPGYHVTDMNRHVWAKFEKNIRELHLLKAMADINQMGEFVVMISQQKTVSGQTFPFESRLS